MLHSVKTTPNTLLFVKVKNRQIIAKENQTVDRNRKIQYENPLKLHNLSTIFDKEKSAVKNNRTFLSNYKPFGKRIF